jgi:acetyl esterase
MRKKLVSRFFYPVSHAEYTMCHVNYRLLVDKESTITLTQIAKDVFGAGLWVKTNNATYNGDPSKIIVPT